MTITAAHKRALAALEDGLFGMVAHGAREGGAAPTGQVEWVDNSWSGGRLTLDAGVVRGVLRTIMWERHDGSPSIRDVREQEVYLARQAHLELPERLLIFWDAWCFCVGEVGALGGEALGTLMPSDLVTRDALDLKRSHTFVDFVRALQTRGRLGWAMCWDAPATDALPWTPEALWACWSGAYGQAMGVDVRVSWQPVAETWSRDDATIMLTLERGGQRASRALALDDAHAWHRSAAQGRATLAATLHILARAERAQPGACLAFAPERLALVRATTTSDTLKALLGGQLSACAPLLDDVAWAADLLDRAG